MVKLFNCAIYRFINCKGDWNEEEFHVGFEGELPLNEVNPRTLMARYLGRLVILEGIVTRCSLVRPKVRKSVHYCDKTKAFHFREYTDNTMIGNDPITTSVYPQKDQDNNPLETEYGFCKYVDFQTISMQEMPEKAPTGQLPRSVDVVLHGDLVDLCKPGDRVKLVGVYRSLGGLSQQNSNPSFRTIVIANNVQPIVKSIYQRPVSDKDIETIKKISKRKNIFEILAESIAPSIYGSSMLKKAVLLQLLGGEEKNLENGTHIRGDINLLLVGDPSTAKSQMLRFVLKMAPLAIATTGRGSSGVGLTAAVVADKDTGDRRLEAGAMVLADRGIVCIDEFDKMTDIDRVTIHEVMEQQTVTIAKAGIHTTLNARCSVLAAANPQFGQYDNRLSPAANTAMPDSLMSRFDLVFILLDEISARRDRILAEHVLGLHSLRLEDCDDAAAHQDDGDQAANADDDDTPWEKFATVDLSTIGSSSTRKRLLKIDFLKKYIHYAKTRIHPELTEEACDLIGEKYVEFRERANQLIEEKSTRVFPVTPRTLESMIRLATAFAKARLSPRVEKKDATEAVALTNYSIFREVKEEASKKSRKSMGKTVKKPKVDSDSDTASDDNSDDDDASDVGEILPARTTRRTAKKQTSMTTSDGDLSFMVDKNITSKTNTDGNNLSTIFSAPSTQKSSVASMPASQPEPPQQKKGVSQQRLNTFMKLVSEARGASNTGSDKHSVNEIRDAVKEKDPSFEEEEIDLCLQKMEERNICLLVGDDLYFMG